MDKKIFAIYGLKYNPFIASVPTDALYICPRLESFYWRVENAECVKRNETEKIIV